MSGRQLDIEETLECARLCLGSEAKSGFEGNRSLGELSCGFRKKIRLDVTMVQHASLSLRQSSR